MNSLSRFLLFFVAGFSLLQFQEVLGKVEEKACPLVVQELTKKQLNGISGCTKQLNLKKGEKAKKMTCIMKCVLKKEALLDDKGQMTPEQFEKFLDKHFPDSLREKATATFKPCVDGAGNMDDGEEFCKDYDPMVKCLLNNFPNLCK